MKLGLIALLAGCTGAPPAEEAAAITQSAAPSSKIDPHSHPNPSRLTNVGGVATLRAVELWTIVWQGMDAIGKQASDFNAWNVRSDYWRDSMREYGVHSGRGGGLIVLTTPPPATLDDTEITPLIDGLIADGTLPKPNDQTVFSFVLSSDTKSTTPFGDTGCETYRGYHFETHNDDLNPALLHVPYEVNLQCPNKSGNISFDDLTYTMSHENAETASDPHPATQPGWTTVDFQEVGDLCNGLGDHFEVEGECGAPKTTYWVTRLYSDRLAGLGGPHDPCVPHPAEPFFGVALEPDNDPKIVIDSDGNGAGQLTLAPFAYGDLTHTTLSWTAYIVLFGSSQFIYKGQSKPGERPVIDVTLQGSIPLDYGVEIVTKTETGKVNYWHGLVTVVQPDPPPNPPALPAALKHRPIACGDPLALDH
jgi:hypothetical protein